MQLSLILLPIWSLQELPQDAVYALYISLGTSFIPEQADTLQIFTDVADTHG